MDFNINVKLEVPNGLNGIINKLKSVYKVDPITEEYVIPSSNDNCLGNVNTLVLWDNYVFQACGNGIKPWIQLSFPKGYIFPNAYSMRGTYEESYGRFYPTSWTVYGIYGGDINNPNKWVKLGENNVNESTYCNNVWSNKGCRDKRVGTFKLKETVPKKGYKYMRWVLKTSCGNGDYFASSGLDIYGVFSKSPYYYMKKKSCRCSNNYFSFVFIAIFTLIN